MALSTVPTFVDDVLYNDITYYIMLYHTVMKPLLSLKDKPWTRKRFAKNTKGCRFWQLFCAILFSIYKNNSNVFFSLIHQNKKGVNATRKRVQESDHLIKIIQRAIKELYDNKYTNLYKIIFNNQNLPCNTNDTSVTCSIPITHLNDLLSSDEPHYYGICVDNTISHYFTIYKKGKNDYHLTSSYGSGFIESPATTQEITLAEFSQFIDDINNMDHAGITDFYNKFFFRNHSVIYSENIEKNEYTTYNEKGYFRQPHVKNVSTLELNQALFHTINTHSPVQPITVCEFIHYQTEIDALIHNAMIGGSSLKKSRSNKRRVRWGRNTYKKIPSRHRYYE